MSEYLETCRLFKEASQEKRKRNREFSTNLLKEQGIAFQSRNNGAHLLIETPSGRVNFYPGTGLFNGSLEGRGVRNLIKMISGKN